MSFPAYFYPASLAVISVLVFVAERLWPLDQKKGIWRRALPSDFIHLIFNGHFLGVMVYGLAVRYVLPPLDGWLNDAGLSSVVYRNLASEWPILLQVVVALFFIDLLQWGVHNLLHRVPFLWEFHKVHHSVGDGEMDWIVSFRFQWTEVILYKSLLYLPLAFFGFGTEAVMFHAVFGTLIGHLNHANLKWDYGPLRYLLNNPPMHRWHHDYDGNAKTTVNYGIIFSCWDHLFKTARVPDHPPAHLGFSGVETFPRDFFTQSTWPLPLLFPRTRVAHVALGLMGFSFLTTFWLVGTGRVF
jgi:sterol desaturase/sphingolipid hydroxylase (fatty acid hydroxylase superfamily)